MNLDIVLIDLLTPEGVLTTYKICPKGGPRGLTINRYRDVFPERFSDDDLEIGGTRLYSASSCSIEKLASRLRSFRLDECSHSFSFQFEHMGVPVGPSREAHGGMYNFVLPPGWRCRELYVSDPYDRKYDDVRKKKHFQHSVLWDPECSTQLVEMLLRSSRGSSSFIVAGSASLVAGDPPDTPYVASQESSWPSSRVSDTYLLDSEGRNRLADELAEKSDWLELKPNIFGLGVNPNQMIKYAIRHFQEKVRPREHAGRASPNTGLQPTLLRYAPRRG
ncbi:MAG: hypothetical protein AAGB97_04000 [Dehalococcoidia bacterium]|nr:hypothetical protein [Chloroflexota bacterium]MBT9158814.1 hypothetical protein [Chloroflexota bacterium]MBT9161996.1 hypothetical protein [Chloroflexota bacterium]